MLKVSPQRASPAAALFFIGCLAPAPRVDPLAGLQAAAAYPGLTAAVGLSENTIKAADYTGRAERMSLGHFKAERMFSDIHRLLERNFKSVVKVDGSASAGGSDVFVMLDVRVKVAHTRFDDSEADYRLYFMRGGQVIGEASGIGRKKLGDAPSKGLGDLFGDGHPRLYRAFEMAREDALRQLEKSLREQPALADLAKAASGGAAPSAAGPARAKSYRSDVEAPAFRLPENPDKFALVIGVEKYSAAPPADHAVRDARAVKAHLLALGYPERNVILLTDDQAGRAAMAKYLEAWLPRNTTEKSKVAFYFSGHGAPDPVSGEAYLLPWDGDPKFLDSTAYPLKKLYERLNALPAKSVVVAMDSCFSGSGGRSVLAKGVRPLVSRIDTGSAAVGRAAALTASAADEISGSDDESGHGLFTYHLLKSLGQASGRATFMELHGALSTKVRDAARRENREQTPQLIGSGDASF